MHNLCTQPPQNTKKAALPRPSVRIEMVGRVGLQAPGHVPTGKEAAWHLFSAISESPDEAIRLEIAG